MALAASQVLVILSGMPSFILNSREVVGEFLKFYFCFVL